MGHLTDFELVLTGACIATFCFGFRAYIKNVCLRNFKTSK